MCGVKPILFNTEMVRAILEGRKTVTRRLVKPQPPGGVDGLHQIDGRGRWRSFGDDVWFEIPAPCQPGDILWVRETWSQVYIRQKRYLYKADADRGVGEGANLPIRWHPSIHMPQEAARVFLRVTDVRVERLQTMTHKDAEQEGCWCAMPIDKFAKVWEGTIKPADQDTCGWDANPWVWVISFVRINKAEAIGRCAE